MWFPTFSSFSGARPATDQWLRELAWIAGLVVVATTAVARDRSGVLQSGHNQQSTSSPSRGRVKLPTGGHSPRTRVPGSGPIRWKSGTDGYSPDESEGADASRAACPMVHHGSHR